MQCCGFTVTTNRTRTNRVFSAATRRDKIKTEPRWVPLGRTAKMKNIDITGWFKVFGWVGLTSGLLWSQPAGALTVTALGTGKLPSGDLVTTIQITLNPGDSLPWHYHTGPGWGTILSGTLTEDHGCASPLEVYAAGSAFSEVPGRVHRVFNFGTVPVVLLFTEIVPSCYTTARTVFVSGPECEGQSGRSHLVEIPPCTPAADDSEDARD
jgi:quercetin dioxygenase-like cupin family protein